MTDEKEKSSFWATLPGILTGVAGVLTATGGIILGLHQIGALGSRQGHAENVTPSAVSTPKQETLPFQPNTAPSASNDSAVSTAASRSQPSEVASVATTLPQAGDDIPPKAIRVTKTDGAIVWSFEDKFSFRGGQSIEFENGQSIPLDKITTIDVLSLDEDKKTLRVTLTNGKTFEGVSHMSCDVFGKNDLGDIDVDERQIKRVTFPH